MVYMGSKQKIAKHIVPILQKYIADYNIEWYIEPFVGGANVIDKIDCHRKTGSDINRYLIALLKSVKKDVPLLKYVTKSMYDDAYNEMKIDKPCKFYEFEIGNIGFLASYNGRFFEGYSIGTKDGTRNYYKERCNNLWKQSRKDGFKNCEFYSCDYRVYSTVRNALIYYDIPYKNTKKYKTNNFDYVDFWNWCRFMSQFNIVIVSEETAPNDVSLIWEQPIKRSINFNGTKYSTEKLFTIKGGEINGKIHI